MKTRCQPPQNWKACHRCVGLLILLIASALRVAGGGISPIVIVNTPTVPPAGGSVDSMAPIISPDGRYVLFASSANNLALNNSVNSTPAPISAAMNVFLRDRLAQT